MHQFAPDELVRQLSEKIDAALAEAIATSEVVCLDHPLYTNPGDAAIYLGTQAALSRCGLRQSYVSDLPNHSDSGLSRALSMDHTILLQGGGNWGDLWPEHQRYREWIMSKYRSFNIVQLSQSIHFDDLGKARLSADALGRHGRFTLMVRDERSYAFAMKYYSSAAKVMLVPDMALALGQLSSGVRPQGIECLVRDDIESLSREWPVSGARERVRDWSRSDPTRAELRVTYAAVGLARRMSDSLAVRSFSANSCYLHAARRTLRPAVVQIAGAQAIVSDRLHAHVLSLLLGRPHVMLSERSGKVGALIETWTKQSSLVHRADSPVEALSLARSLIRC